MTEPSLPSLFPPPKDIRAIPGADSPRPDTPVEVRTDSTLPPEGYRLTWQQPVALIEHSDAAGLRWAERAVATLRAQRPHASVAVLIEDSPDFAVRGFMLDVSRDRVPTRAALARLVEVLDVCRYNHLELYVENTFAYRDHAPAWSESSPLTAADVRWLDDLCASRGIDLVANQNTFGHWERWLERPEYRNRAENPDGMSFHGGYRSASTLAPTPENASLVQELLEELLPNFRARRVNIGADETFELGTGVSAQRAAEIGLGQVYYDYVTQIAQPWLEQGYEVEFWADILASYPDLIARLPEGMVPIVWQYDSPRRLREGIAGMAEDDRKKLADHGVDIDTIGGGFSDRAQSLINSGRPFWVAPGTSTWLSLLGDLDNAVENIDDAWTVGTGANSKGILLTAWGDNGHYDPLIVSYAPISYAGATAWNHVGTTGLDLADVVSRELFDDPTGAIGAALVEAGRVNSAAAMPLLNAGPLFQVLLAAGCPAPEYVPSPDALGDMADRIDRATALIAQAQPANPAAANEIAQFRTVLSWSRFAIDLLGRRDVFEAAQPTPELQAAAGGLLDRFDSLREQQRTSWLLAARPGGLERSLAEFAPLRAALSTVAGR